GGRVTFNLHPIVGIEYQMAYFPGYGAGEDSKTQGSGHIKLTYRLEENRRLNVFAIVGPGFLHENFSYTGSIGHIVYRYRSVAVDYGVGLEILAHRRFLVRMDITDFYAGRKFLPFSPLAGSRSWDHHLDLKVAGMFRF
ncbi:MAG: hypothetical protein DMG07_28830, partial [Acidobacteria bacterium]